MQETNGFNLSTDLPGQIISEIVKVLGVLIALYAFIMPLENVPFWIVTIAAGSIVFLAGLFYAFRLYRKRIKHERASVAARERFISEAEIPAGKIVVHEHYTSDLVRIIDSDPESAADSSAEEGQAIDSVQTVVIDPKIEKQFEAVQAMYETGLMSAFEFKRLNSELQEKKKQSLTKANIISRKLTALKTEHDAGELSDDDYKERVDTLLDSQVDVLEKSGMWNVLPPLVISIGFFLVLPGVVALIMLQSNRESATSFVEYFFAPVIILWIISEILFLFPLQAVKPKGAAEVVGIVGAGLQVLGAIVLWIYLGQTIVNKNLIWVFYVGVGLSFVGLIVVIVGIVVYVRKRKQQRSQQLETFMAAYKNNGRVSNILESPNAPESPNTRVASNGLTGVEFRRFVGKEDKLYFRLCDHDGNILLTSQGYRSRQGRDNGIAAVKNNMSQLDRYDRRTAVDGLFYFVILAKNQRVIAKSLFFKTEEEREAVIEAVSQTAVSVEL